MDRNLLLAFALSFAVLMVWTMSQEKPQPPRPELDATQLAESEDRTRLPAPSELPPTPSERGPVVRSPEVSPAPTSVGGMESLISVDRPLYSAQLTTQGAALREWYLSAESNYDQGPRRDHSPLVLTTATGTRDVLTTPFLELGLGDLSKAIFEKEDTLGDGYAFTYRSGNVTVRKHYHFEEESYAFRLQVEVRNDSAETVPADFVIEWPAKTYDAPDFVEQSLIVLFEGDTDFQPLNAFGIPSFFSRNPDQEEVFGQEVDWGGVQTTYFLGVLLPESPAQAKAKIVALEPGELGLVELSYPTVHIPPGQSFVREYRGYIGPKEVERLTALGGDTIRSIDLGWSWVEPLTRFFSWFLGVVYGFVGNYGVAIIVLTILVRVATLPLTMKQMRSMERMRALQPQVKEVQANFKDDKQKQSEAMMALYRKEKVNPLSGCLPMVLQLPVFIGLFYALRSSIHLRQAPFVGWIDDLSAPEELFVIPGLDLPVRILPLLMGASMYVQQKITPMQMDPAQAKMMITVMPVMMTLLFYQFPSGLVLYWMVSNVLAITHQTWVGRGLKRQGKPQLEPQK